MEVVLFFISISEKLSFLDKKERKKLSFLDATFPWLEMESIYQQCWTKKICARKPAAWDIIIGFIIIDADPQHF